MNDKKRLEVIECSIVIEKAVSLTLASILDIDLENSKTLGNKSSSLSFKQKLDLLADIRILDLSTLKKFQTFTEIRNQFAHNFDVYDFSTCLSGLTGAEKLLRKQYKLENAEVLNNEDQLHILYTLLFSDILNIISDVMKKVQDRYLKLAIDLKRKQIPTEMIKILDGYLVTNPKAAQKLRKLIIGIKDKFEL